MTSYQAVPVADTDAELDELPVGSVVFDIDRDVIVRAVEGWRFWGDDSDFTEDATICLPAMVIHVGQSEPWHATEPLTQVWSDDAAGPDWQRYSYWRTPTEKHPGPDRIAAGLA